MPHLVLDFFKITYSVNIHSSEKAKSMTEEIEQECLREAFNLQLHGYF